mgnify:FL=1
MTPEEKKELKRLYRKRDKLLAACDNNEELNEKIRALQRKIIDR